MSQTQAPVHARPPSRWLKFFQPYMMAVGIGGNGFFYVQAYEVFRTQSAKDVSLLAFAVALWAVSSWLVYGLLLRNQVIIWANVVAVIGASLVIIGKFLYG